jgi:predicted dehydrogenase/phage shock protein A
MGPSDSFRDPKIQLSEGIRQIREALHALREGVVMAVKRRNQLQDEVAKLERLIADLETKAALAEKIGNPSLAAELREERKRREAELAKMRTLLTRLEADAESAKIQLPEEEARLLQQANDLKAQFARLAGAQVEASAPESLGTPADEMFTRAADKVRDLEREASAREEVASVRAGDAAPGSTYTPRSVPPSPDQSAEAMLSALESRLGMAPEATSPGTGTQGAITPNPLFLELDGRPTAPDVAAPPAPPAQPSATPPPAAAPPKQEPQNTATAEAQTPEAPTKTASSEPAKAVGAPMKHVVPHLKGENSRMEPTKRVRIAAVGTGNIFRGAHLPAYPEILQAQLVALCDPDKQAQDLAYKRYQGLVEAKIKQARERDDLATIERLESDLETVQICDDISEVIETIKPDLVDICTQPFLHTPLSIQALEAGIHVMCEKPISRSWLESQRLIETVQRTGKFYQHNENWLFEKEYYTAKKLVDAGAIGEPVLMFLATAHGGPEGSPKFWNSDFGGGGALLDNGIHAIGASWYISGLEKRPTYVKAAEPFGMSIRMPYRILDGRYQQVQVDDDAHILIRFENPQTHAWATAHVEGSWSHRDSPDTVIIGTTGRISFVSEEGRRYAVVTDAYDREARRIETSGPTWQPWPSSFYGEILNMVECVRNGVPSITDASFGAECSAIVGASYLSQRDGKRAVPVEEFKAFARDIATRYPNDPAGADNALVDALLAAIRKK